MSEHSVDQAIERVTIHIDADNDPVRYLLGKAGVTRIEACEKSGMYSNIPYVRVWAGDQCLAEFCQHNIVGVYFAPSPPTAGGSDG